MYGFLTWVFYYYNTQFYKKFEKTIYVRKVLLEKYHSFNTTINENNDCFKIHVFFKLINIHNNQLKNL
jgi:hypothetical protein